MSEIEQPSNEAPLLTEGVVPEPIDDGLGDGGKKAIKAERDARKEAEKRATELQKQLDEIEAAKLSDLERAQRELEDTRSALEQASREALRFRIAAKYNIGDEDAELFLTGSDEETLEKQAKRLSDSSKPVTPLPDGSQGGGATPVALNSRELEGALKQKLGIVS